MRNGLILPRISGIVTVFALCHRKFFSSVTANGASARAIISAKKKPMMFMPPLAVMSA
jgi:hypothetical protein